MFYLTWQRSKFCFDLRCAVKVRYSSSWFASCLKESVGWFFFLCPFRIPLPSNGDPRDGALWDGADERTATSTCPKTGIHHGCCRRAELQSHTPDIGCYSFELTTTLLQCHPGKCEQYWCREAPPHWLLLVSVIPHNAFAQNSQA